MQGHQESSDHMDSVIQNGDPEWLEPRFLGVHKQGKHFSRIIHIVVAASLPGDIRTSKSETLRDTFLLQAVRLSCRDGEDD